MVDSAEGRRRLLLLVVLGIIVLVVAAYLVIAQVEGDHTDQIDPQNGDSAPSLVR
ncbi:hypothetical protein ACVW2K_000333 [Nocardioides sp. HB32]